MKVIDLTHTITEKMPVFPGTEQPQLITVNNYDEVLRRIEQLKPAHLICDVRISEVSESETDIDYAIVSSSCEHSSVIISEV